jgi:hypothetical protein
VSSLLIWCFVLLTCPATFQAVTEPILECPKCHGPRTRTKSGKGYECVSCERERKRAAKRMMAQKRRERAEAAEASRAAASSCTFW